MPALHVKAFDHLVLKVADVERSLGFYTTLLGLQPENVDDWRAGQAPFPSVRITPDTIIDIVEGPRADSNVDHFCLVVDPLDWADVIATGHFTVLEGPVQRSGARGEATSIYIQDPDGNTIELRWYPEDKEA